MLILAKHEVESEVWRKVAAELTRRRDEYRLQNDAGIDHEKTTRLRGRIAELNELLEMAKPPEPPVRTVDHY